ncbi:GAF domain-containing SpoIIE family protein phosphatase [Actinomycetospora chiangmaiensis]|uniref:GAF domain-containing SpoIIE family protein phosphatase n=1 Tax=Actinomycetospora chiangmaiensis TaxID=402650 RepID=UPI00037B080A|nr:GAF domain-containing SpoIIE family protein phosphatase [Actinomycetospora chiangmaiensis]
MRTEPGGQSGESDTVQDGGDGLDAPARLRSLYETGLGAVPDRVLDRAAERVRALLGVPVALVSLVDPEGQYFPGQAGLPDPWAQQRRTPLSHSFCRHVVVSAEPLVVSDAREDARLQENLAIRDLSVIAYAGVPLLDDEGNVLGSLCAIDHVPRDWTAREVDLLAALADGVSAELRVRVARVEAARERRRRDRVEQDLSASYQRSQSLLRASQAFSDAGGLADIRRRLADLVSSTLRPASVRVAVLDNDGVHRLHDGATATPREGSELPWTDRGASNGSARELLTVVGDGDEPDDGFPEGFRAWLARQGMRVALVVRLVGDGDDLGLVVLGWPEAPALGPADRLYATTIAGYVAQAVARVRFVEHRVHVAHEMQTAMLAPLPDVAGVELVARYQPADDHEDVGGDWYDVSLLPDPEAGSAELVVAASVGDVVGHTLDSAIRMGQVRSMLRQAAWDIGAGPAAALSATERAIAGDDLGHAGTAVLAHLRRRADHWALTWTNAGHPPPVLVTTGGAVRALDGLDPLFGYSSVLRRARQDHTTELDDGDTLFLHTDGLIERIGEDLDDAHRRLHAALARHADLALADLVDATIADVAPAATDDVVVLAIQLTGTRT